MMKLNHQILQRLLWLSVSTVQTRSIHQWNHFIETEMEINWDFIYGLSDARITLTGQVMLEARKQALNAASTMIEIWFLFLFCFIINLLGDILPMWWNLEKDPHGCAFSSFASIWLSLVIMVWLYCDSNASMNVFKGLCVTICSN